MENMRKWRRHTEEFKRQAVERMKTCANIHELASELQIERKLLYTWKYQFEGRPEPRHANLEETAEERKEKQLQAEILRLKQKLGEKADDLDFFKDALLRVKQARQKESGVGETASMKPSGQGRKGKAN